MIPENYIGIYGSEYISRICSEQKEGQKVLNTGYHRANLYGY